MFSPVPVGLKLNCKILGYDFEILESICFTEKCSSTKLNRKTEFAKIVSNLIFNLILGLPGASFEVLTKKWNYFKQKRNFSTYCPCLNRYMFLDWACEAQKPI